MSGGTIHRWLTAAARDGGSARGLYTPEGASTRRSFVERVERRARDLAAAGVREGDVVGLMLGNVAESIVVLGAASRLGAIVMPVEAAQGDAPLIAAAARMPLRAVIRRPRGDGDGVVPYPPGYKLVSRRRLPQSLASIDVLEPPADIARPMAGTELVVEVIGVDGVARDLQRDGADLERLASLTATKLELDPRARLAVVDPITSPRWLDLAVLPALHGGAALVMCEGPTIDVALDLVPTAESIVAIASLGRVVPFERVASNAKRQVNASLVVPWAPTDHPLLKSGTPVFTGGMKRLLHGVETGPLGTLAPKQKRLDAWVPLTRGAATDTKAHAVLADTVASGRFATPTPEHGVGLPASAEPSALRTGWLGTFKGEALATIEGPDHRWVEIEGRHGCLACIERILLDHKRIKAARVEVQVDAEGETTIDVVVTATGTTPLDELDDFLVGRLPAHLVPRRVIRQAS